MRTATSQEHHPALTCTPPNSALACFPDNCKKMGLVFEHVVGIVEIINCKDVKVQVCLPARFHANDGYDSLVASVRRSWGRSPPSPSTRQTVATST